MFRKHRVQETWALRVSIVTRAAADKGISNIKVGSEAWKPVQYGT
jgi:hypothetical protein